VLENGQALLIDDAPQDPEFGKHPSIVNYNIRSIMCVPLASPGNAPLGIIQIHTENRRSLFKNEDLETLVNVATIAAFKLENDRMHRELRAQERLRVEKNAAKEVQMAFLPATCPTVAGYSFDAYYKSAGEVGGDYYDFIVLDDGRVAIALGDVSGKGLAAALLMAHLRADVRSAARSNSDPASAVRFVNRSLCEAGPAEKFVSLLYMVLDTRRHELFLVTAGHLPPLLRSTDGAIKQIGREEAGPLLKFSPDHKYDVKKITLEPGSLVFVFTDGVIDALNAKQKAYKLERLRETFQQALASPEEVLDAIVADLHRFTGDAPQFDDIAMICFGRNAG
jgi:serine phosphatase RsbU (regulator of sigma subunit)